MTTQEELGNLVFFGGSPAIGRSPHYLGNEESDLGFFRFGNATRSRLTDFWTGSVNQRSYVAAFLGLGVELFYCFALRSQNLLDLGN